MPTAMVGKHGRRWQPRLFFDALFHFSLFFTRAASDIREGSKKQSSEWIFHHGHPLSPRVSPCLAGFPNRLTPATQPSARALRPLPFRTGRVAAPAQPRPCAPVARQPSPSPLPPCSPVFPRDPGLLPAARLHARRDLMAPSRLLFVGSGRPGLLHAASPRPPRVPLRGGIGPAPDASGGARHRRVAWAAGPGAHGGPSSTRVLE